MAGYIQALEEENGTGTSAHTNPSHMISRQRLLDTADTGWWCKEVWLWCWPATSAVYGGAEGLRRKLLSGSSVSPIPAESNRSAGTVDFERQRQTRIKQELESVTSEISLMRSRLVGDGVSLESLWCILPATPDDAAVLLYCSLTRAASAVMKLVLLWLLLHETWFVSLDQYI
jgi:hypothetical protein